MTSALSNPYELTIGGVTCKASPYGAGYYITNEDLEKLGKSDCDRFKKALFEFYDVAQSESLEGLKVLGLKLGVKK